MIRKPKSFLLMYLIQQEILQSGEKKYYPTQHSATSVSCVAKIRSPFLFVFFLLAYFLKKEIWKDVK